MNNRAHDGFERYFSEKLWEMIPSVYRHEDGVAENPGAGVLRALVEIIGEQAAIIRRSHDRLWEDQFIELCDDWAIPYLGDLVGARLVSVLIKRGLRADVAKTIYYRRRKGTVQVLEELIRDIAGWEGKVVENFRRLGRTRHGLDPVPSLSAGQVSGTFPGGWADVRQPEAAELANGPFSEFHYTADMRRHRGVFGRYGIHKLAFHLYRLTALRVENSNPNRVSASKKKFRFDPSGRDIALFIPGSRTDEYNWERWRTAKECEVPAPMRCMTMTRAKVEVLEKAIIRIEESPGVAVPPDKIIVGDLSVWKAQARGKRLVIDPELGRFLFLGNRPRGKVNVFYYYGFPGEIGAGTYDRRFYKPSIVEGSEDYNGELMNPDRAPLLGGGRISDGAVLSDGVTEIGDNKTYGPVADVSGVKDLVLQSSNKKRPHLRINRNWVLESGTNKSANLVLNGLWIDGKNQKEVTIRGNYEKIVLRHVTIDPGGSADVTVNNEIPKNPVCLVIEGRVEKLKLYASVTGPIRTQGKGRVENLMISDSIIQSVDPKIAALSVSGMRADMKCVTILGDVNIDRLWASELLATGIVHTRDTQSGCFRFSAALDSRLLFSLGLEYQSKLSDGDILSDLWNEFKNNGILLSQRVSVSTKKEGKHWLVIDKDENKTYSISLKQHQLDVSVLCRLPRQYESHKIKDIDHYFTSWRFGDPGYAQLSKTIPLEICRGAENGSEIGAFNNLYNPIKLESLKAKVDEYMPFGLIPVYISET